MTLSSNLKTIAIIGGMLPAVLASASAAIAAGDPTQGRIQQRQSQNLAQYHECAAFALRVYQGGLSQAKGEPRKVRAAQSHYQANLGRCRAKFL